MFRQSVLNTFYFVALTVPAFVILGLFLALALNDSYRAQRGAARHLLRLVRAVGDHRHADLAAGLHARARHAGGRRQRVGLQPRELHDHGIAGPAGRGHRHRLVDHRPADDAVPGGAAADPARGLRGRGARQRLALAHADAHHPAVHPAHHRAGGGDRADPAVPDLRPDPPDHQWRAEQLHPPDRDVHLRSRLPRLGAGLRSGRLAGAVRPHAGRILLPDLDRPLRQED